MFGGASGAHAATGTISGTTYQDTNRNGIQDSGEQPFANEVIYVLDSTGQNIIAAQYSDSNGHYSFGGLADGTYEVSFDASSWYSMRDSWVPTTTGTLMPNIWVSLSGLAQANFGWRSIVRSTDMYAPIASYTAPNGLVVQSYDDVVAPQTLYNDLVTGSMIGAEASTVTLRFDYGNSGDVYSASAVQSNGQYISYKASIYVTYDAWLDTGDVTLFHEYGHAWSLYYAYIVQQDPTLAGYLAARGLTGDSRVDSTYGWNKAELIAEDYRQLFGSPNAAAAPQANKDIPPAAQVAGLKDYLATTFRQAPSGSGQTSPPPTSTQTVQISGLAVNPSPVSKSGTVSFGLSIPASVTLTIVNAKGTVVRTLLSKASEPGGAVSATWDRKDSSGKRVASGTYKASVTAVDASGHTATSSYSFSVS